MAKGGSFEREIAKKLSLWWSGGKSDDVFWRTSNSGGRATTRRKKGQKSYAGHGDLSYTHPDGKPFIDYFALELKRGYNKNAKKGRKVTSSFQSLVDAPAHVKAGVFEEWIHQAEQAKNNAESFSWALIHKADSQREMIYMPYSVMTDLIPYDVLFTKKVFVVIRFVPKIKDIESNIIAGIRLDSFLRSVKPQKVRLRLEKWKKQI